jgi:hypothetical protein
MKRLPLILAGTLLLVLALAAPALAGPPLTHEPSPPADTAIFTPWDGGMWMEFPDGTLESQIIHPAGTPVPADYDTVVFSGWLTIALGRANSAPCYLQYKVSLDSKVVTTYRQSKAYWTGAFRVAPDPTMAPFNPKVSAGLCSNWMFIPLARPESGVHTLDVSELIAHPTTDMLVAVGDPTASWHPVQFPAGVDFTGTFPVVFE